jgi:hypothetical protein
MPAANPQIRKGPETRAPAYPPFLWICLLATARRSTATRDSAKVALDLLKKYAYIQSIDFIEYMPGMPPRHCQEIPSGINSAGLRVCTGVDVGSFAAEASSQALLSISIPTEAASA